MFLGETRERNKSASPGRFYKAGLPVYPVETFPAQTVELIMVRVANQPYGLLLKQVYNIARPEDEMFTVIRPSEPENGREWAEILYQGKSLRVLELARKLQLVASEALTDSKILLSGQLVGGGNIQQPFGLSVDDIIGIWHIGLDKMRLLDGWVCRKRLGRLIWGMALFDREAFGNQHPAGSISKENLQPALAFNGIIGETELLPGAEARNGSGQTEADTGEMSNFEKSRLLRNSPSAAIPVMLLDLEVLRTALYPF